MGAQHRLATYGTLAPNRVNHHQLDGLDGQWFKGTIKGCLHNAGWGAKEGFPGLTAMPERDIIDVYLFESLDLPAHWARLDAFEGEGYERGTIKVTIKRNGKEECLDASIYFLSPYSLGA